MRTTRTCVHVAPYEHTCCVLSFAINTRGASFALVLFEPIADVVDPTDVCVKRDDASGSIGFLSPSPRSSVLLLLLLRPLRLLACLHACLSASLRKEVTVTRSSRPRKGCDDDIVARGASRRYRRLGEPRFFSRETRPAPNERRNDGEEQGVYD